jgi:uncharacterized protein
MSTKANVDVKLNLRKIPEGESQRTLQLNPSQLEYPKDEITFQGGIQGDLIVSRRSGEIKIHGELTFRTSLTCSRCLLPFEMSFTEDIFLRYLKGNPHRMRSQSGEIEMKDEDLSTNFYDGDVIEIGSALRDIILLAFPVKPLCRENCRGLCPRCGQDLNLGDCGCPKKEKGSRWDGLKDFA